MRDSTYIELFYVFVKLKTRPNVPWFYEKNIVWDISRAYFLSMLRMFYYAHCLVIIYCAKYKE